MGAQPWRERTNLDTGGSGAARTHRDNYLETRAFDRAVQRPVGYGGVKRFRRSGVPRGTRWPVDGRDSGDKPGIGTGPIVQRGKNANYKFLT
jgi:hypothetical protein